MSFILDPLTTLINDVIVVLGAVASWAIGILPGFPSAPGAPSSGILGFICWVIPVGPMLAVFSVLVTAWTLFLGVKIALRWVKAI